MTMRDRGYYSVRTGRHPAGAKLDLPSFKKLFLSLDRQFTARDYFQEAFGYECVDAGRVPGSLGEDITGVILVAIRKEGPWPLHDRISDYSEDDLFDVIEFLYDHVSKPVDGHYHSYGGCGMHYATFNRPEGQAEYRTALTPILGCYDSGYELSVRGEILALPEAGMALPANMSETVTPWEFRVEGEQGSEADEHSGAGPRWAGDRGRGEGDAATVHPGVQAEDRPGGRRRVRPRGRWGRCCAARGCTPPTWRHGVRRASAGSWRARRRSGGRPRVVTDARDKVIAEQARELTRWKHAPSGPRRWSKSKKTRGAAGDAARVREVLMAMVVDLSPRLGIAPTCAALGLPRATYYRRRQPRRHASAPAVAPGPSAGGAGGGARRAARGAVRGPRPRGGVRDPARRGQYLCSERTMYRLLAAHGEVRERRDQLRHPRLRGPGAAGPPAQRALELGHHQAARARRSGPTSTCT